MLLSKYNLKNVDKAHVIVPDDKIFGLPEKVLQFGTGVLLRGLPDYMIDKANRQGIFKGRIVVVKSTDTGDSSAFEKQDCLYTISSRGLENGINIEENIICSAISRVLSAKHEWTSILECAHNPQMQVIISNTTERGIELVNDDIRKHPPVSFPGKLLAFLFERYKAFAGSAQSGMVIVPTELIPENGRKLESIVLELAHLNALDVKFIEWLENNNHFCNSLVDRIVPGKPDNLTRKHIQESIGYIDELITVAEVYRLWAIEGDNAISQILSFHCIDKGVIIAPDINLFRELKLRLLNGTHILASGVAFLSGINTVNEAMEDQTICSFISELMLNEISLAIPYPVTPIDAEIFANQVIERFGNPLIHHPWLNITMNYSVKLQLRVIPILLRYYEVFQSVPENMATSFAAFILFVKVTRQDQSVYYGECNGKEYVIYDENAPYYFLTWKSNTPEEVVSIILEDFQIWGTDLTLLPGFATEVTNKLVLMIKHGVMHAVQSKKVLA